MTGTEALEPLKQLLEVTDDPTRGPENLCVTAMPDGRMIMYEAGRRNGTFEYEEEMARLSNGREVWFGGYDTCVMVSTMALWRNGSEVWAVEQIPHVAERDIVVRGTPPPFLDEIKDKTKPFRGIVINVDYVLAPNPRFRYFEWAKGLTEITGP